VVVDVEGIAGAPEAAGAVMFRILHSCRGFDVPNGQSVLPFGRKRKRRRLTCNVGRQASTSDVNVMCGFAIH
jgi:hypothetical protein